VELCPSEIFQPCHSIYKEYRFLLAESVTVRNPLTIPYGKVLPAKGPRMDDYVANFDLAGRRALRQPGRELKRRLFQTYYVEDTSYQGTLKLLRIRPDVFDYWTMEIKRTVGEELARAGIYPPDRYFRKTWNGQGI